jgi:ABC-type multidrug transport system ATPase subunit
MNWRITLQQVSTEDPGGGLVIEPRDKPFVLGRASEVDLFVPDATASRRHCQIVWVEGQPRIEDLGSRIGTLLNGRRVTAPTPLTQGDEIGIGELRFGVALEPVTDDAPGGAAATAAPPDPPAAESRRAPAPGAGPREHTLLPEAPIPKAPPGGGRERTIISDEYGPTRTARLDLHVQVPEKGLAVGRDDDCDFVLPSPMVSRRHVSLKRTDDAWIMRDLRSANGTFVNGRRISGAHRLRAGDRVRIGPYDLEFDGAMLVAPRRLSGTSIELRGIGQQVNHRETGEPIWLLRDVSFTVTPGELVGVFGSSGCGKSTLVDAMNGRRPAGHGEVRYAGENLYDEFALFKTGIGHVPQELVLHRELPVESALRYAAQLRLPSDTADAEIDDNIDRVLRLVGLAPQRGVRVENLSGGQKKRVSIAMELLSQPSVLFLDEATSGLDLVTESEMMQIFRSLADGGVTTVCITHYAHSLPLCDLVVYLMGGRLVYVGPPDELLRHFGVDDVRDVYLKERSQSAESWEEYFRASSTYRRYVIGRASAPPSSEHGQKLRPGDAVGEVDAEHAIRQFSILSRRYLETILSDRRHVLLLLALAPILALVPRLRFDVADAASDRGVQTLLSFSAMLTAFFLGIFGSVREIVKEDGLYRHERFANLEIPPYLASKSVLLLTVNAIQALELLICFTFGDGLNPTHWWTMFPMWFALFLTAASGTMLGLAISAAVRTASQAMLIMIIAIVPQVLFNNALLPRLTGWTERLAYLVPGYWSVDLLMGGVANLSPAGDVKGYVVLPLMCCLCAVAAVIFLRRKDGPRGRLYAIPKLRKGWRVAIETRLRKLVRVLLGHARGAAAAIQTAGEGAGRTRRT